MTATENLAGWGLLLPTFDPLHAGVPLIATARRAEEVGFDSAWVGDHLHAYAPVLEATCSLAAVAAVTDRMRLGFSIMLIAARNLAWTAKQIGTLDALAPGRIVMGVGAGGVPPNEWDIVGVDIKTRGRRTDEMIPLIQQILRGEAVEHTGPLITTSVPVLEPVPKKLPPLVVGGTSDAALRRAAKFGDGWLASMVDAAFVAKRTELLREFAEEAGRPTPQTGLVVFCHVTDDKEKGLAAADAYLKGQHGIPFAAVSSFSPVGSAAYVADQLSQAREAGADGFVLIPMSTDPIEQVEKLAEIKSEVMSTKVEVSA